MKVASLVHGVLDATQPVFRADDEAVLRGSAAFETVRVYDGRPFLLDEHLARFRTSIDALALEWADPAPLVGQLAQGDGVLRLYRTSLDLVATYDALPSGLEEERARGLRVRTVDVASPAALEGVKATSYAYAFAARRESGADEVVFLSGDLVLEATTANIWWRRGDELFTPRIRAGVLPGVTRGFVCSIEDVTEADFPVEDLRGADEAFLTSSIREVMPVVEIDGQVLGDGRPGPTAARLQAALRLRSAA